MPDRVDWCSSTPNYWRRCTATSHLPYKMASKLSCIHNDEIVSRSCTLQRIGVCFSLRIYLHNNNNNNNNNYYYYYYYRLLRHKRQHEHIEIMKICSFRRRHADQLSCDWSRAVHCWGAMSHQNHSRCPLSERSDWVEQQSVHFELRLSSITAFISQSVERCGWAAPPTESAD